MIWMKQIKISVKEHVHQLSKFGGPKYVFKWNNNSDLYAD